MTAPILKHGELISAAYRGFVASLNCAHCGRAPRSEVHHFPGRGASGVIFDFRTCPLCSECHRRAGGQYCVSGGLRLAPIASDLQTLYVAQTVQRFIEQAPMEVVEQVMREHKRWRESRGEAVAW